MEDQIVARFFTELVHHGCLSVAEDLRSEVDRAGFVNAVYVPEDGGEEVEAPIECPKDLSCADHVGRTRVQLVAVDALVVHRVLDSAYDPDLEFEDHVEGGAFVEELRRH